MSIRDTCDALASRHSCAVPIDYTSPHYHGVLHIRMLHLGASAS